MCDKTKFLSRVARAEDGCWNWIGHLNHEGYGLFYKASARTRTRAHRSSYELFVGPIPDGLVIDHLCLNKMCVNPLHLEPVRGGENSRRFFLARTHCANGHEYTPGNVRILAGTLDTRVCKACDAARVRKYNRKKQGILA